MTTLGVGISGIGWCAGEHIKAFRKNPHTEVRLLHGRDEGRVRANLARYAERLHGLSPLAVLQRGYSITRREADGAVVTDASTLVADEQLRIVLHQGAALVRVVRAPAASTSSRG